MKRIVVFSVFALVVFGSLAEAQTRVKPNMFRTKEACQAALESGNFRPYKPQYFGLNRNNPTNNQDRVLVTLEADMCLEMHVVGGRKFVVQEEGVQLRAYKRTDGWLIGYARNDCGNPVYGVAFPPPVQPVLAEPEPELVPFVALPRQVTPVAVVPVTPKKKSSFWSGKKVLLIAGVLGGAYATYYYWPCPPGTVRKR